MVLGITKNSDEMAEMFDIAQRLGKALGQDTRLSVESLITGIGRQSRMMLDNIGIVVDTNKAYKDYAAILGKSADKLTDLEKKQAFLNATLDAATNKVSKLGDDTSATIDEYDRLATAWVNASTQIGSSFNKDIAPVLAKTLEFYTLIQTTFGDLGKLYADFALFSPRVAESFVDALPTKEDLNDTFTFDLMDDDVFGNMVQQAEQFNVVTDDIKEKITEITPKMKEAANQINSLAGAMSGYVLMSQQGSRTIKGFGDVVIKQMERIVSTFLANYATFKLMSFFFPGFSSLAAMPTLFGWTPKHNGGKIEEYHTGGMIPEYHTGGNVPIMAQEGEYVIRRDAVDSIGVENLNRMNRTGQASGGVNITFSGNVLSRDFIEDEAIPMIKNAIRKGADIGIS